MDARSHTIDPILHKVVGKERGTEGDRGPHKHHVTLGKGSSVLEPSRLWDPVGWEEGSMAREELSAVGE